MPHLESKTKLIMTASVNKYINPQKIVISDVCLGFLCQLCGLRPRIERHSCTFEGASAVLYLRTSALAFYATQYHHA